MGSKLFLCLIFAFATMPFVDVKSKDILIDDRIIGGEDTDIDMYPSMVSIFTKYDTGFICGGSIITTKLVVTAAHCLFEKYNYTIRLGSATLTNGEILNILFFIKHDSFSWDSAENDIGMLILENEIKFSSKVQPIILPEQNEQLPPSGTDVTFVGWGISEVGGSNSSEYLQRLHVHIMNNIDCKKVYELRLKDKMFCAGGRPHAGACSGDSGGPAIYNGKVIGIISFKYDCRYPGFPLVLTNVAMYRYWIDNNILKLKQSNN